VAVEDKIVSVPGWG